MGTSMTKWPSQEKLQSFVYGVQDGVVGLKSLSPSISTQARHGRGVSVPASCTVTDTVPVPAQRRLGQANAVMTMAVINIFPGLLFRIVLFLKKRICTILSLTLL